MFVTCPQCRKQLQVSNTAVGRKAQCPSCRNIFEVFVAAVGVEDERGPPANEPAEADPSTPPPASGPLAALAEAAEVSATGAHTPSARPAGASQRPRAGHAARTASGAGATRPRSSSRAGSASPPPVPRRQAAAGGIHLQRLVLAVIAGFGMFATFLPWFEVGFFGSVLGARGDGWISFGLFTAAMVIALRGRKSLPLGQGAFVGANITAGLAGLVGLYHIADVPPLVHIGAGLYLLVISAVGFIAAAFLLRRPPTSASAGHPRGPR